MKAIRTVCVISIFFMCATLAAAQDSKISDVQDKSTKASVYIYQALAAHARRSSSPIYADGKQLADLESGRYFIVILDPGRHTFRSKDKKQAAVTLDLKKGEAYYLRLEPQATSRDGKQRFTAVAKEKGALEIRQMTPVKSGDIKDRSIVVTDYNVIESKPNAN